VGRSILQKPPTSSFEKKCGGGKGSEKKLGEEERVSGLEAHALKTHFSTGLPAEEKKKILYFK